MKLSWFNTSMSTHKLYQVYEYEQVNQCKIYEQRVKIQKIKCKHKDMFRDSSHCATSPPLDRRIFTMSTQELPQRDLHRGITTQHREYTTLSLLHTSTQEGGTKQRKRLQLGDHLDYKQSLDDHKGSQTKLFS